MWTELLEGQNIKAILNNLTKAVVIIIIYANKHNTGTKS